VPRCLKAYHKCREVASSKDLVAEAVEAVVEKIPEMHI
jgi:hypothetical protein